MNAVNPYHAAGLFVVGIAVGLGIIGAREWLRDLDRRAEATRAEYDREAFIAAVLWDQRHDTNDTPLYAATCAHIAAFAAEDIDAEWAALMNLIDPSPEGGAA